MLGRTIGNYVIQKKVAEGGMGEVYLAQHPRIGRRVAVKVLHADLGRRADLKARFFTEARAANEIKHEHIIDILDFGELEDGTPYFIMEWLEGRSLGDEIHRVGRMDAARAAHIGVGIGMALRAAHERGIVHRDLKPDNVFLIPRGGDPDFVKVLDFGIAKLQQPGVGPKTETGQILGTPWYMSPEQCRGSAREIDHRSDLYAMGVILYEMVTGSLPFSAESLGELLLAHMTRDARPPRELVPGLVPAMEQIILRAMAKGAADRYQSADELINDLLPLDTLAAEIVQRRTRPQPAEPVDGASADSIRELAATVDAAALTRPKDPESKDPPTVPGDGPPTMESAPAPTALPTLPKVTTLRSAAAEQTPAADPGKRSRAPLAIAAGLLIAVGGIGFVFSRAGNPGPAPQPAITPPPPPAQPAPNPTPAAPPPVESVNLSIRTNPPDARLTLDDAPLDNPFTGRFPKNGVRRRLAASAPGFGADNRWVVLDRDQEIQIQLAPEPPAKSDKPAPRPAADAKKPDSKPVYKGTKGKLITTFPE